MSIHVPPSGSPNSPIAIIGEAPGEDEVTVGCPFVGKSGQNLDKYLSAAGILRSSCYIDNVISERPIGNHIEQFIDLQSHPPAITPEYTAHRAELRERLSIVTSNVIVALGNTALYTLTGQQGISKRRGSIYTSLPEFGSRKVIPTYHPAALLHGGPLTELLRFPLIHDLKKAKEQSCFPQVKSLERNLVLHPTKKEVLDWLDSARRVQQVGFDIETTTKVIKGTKYAKALFCWSLALAPGHSLVCSMVDERGEERFSLEEEREIVEALSLVLRDPMLVKVGQNLGPFDGAYMYQNYNTYPWPIHDTMVAHGVLLPEFPKDLGYICSIYSDEPYYKDTGKFIPGDSRAWEDALKYSALDSAIVLEVMPKLLEDLEKANMLAHYKSLISIHPCLAYMEARGIKMDVEGLGKAGREARAEIKGLQKELNDIFYKKVQGPILKVCMSQEEVEVFLREKGLLGKSKKVEVFWLEGFNVKSVPLKKAYFKLIGEKLPTENSKESTDAKSMAKLAAKGVVEARLIQRLTRLRDDESKYWSARLTPEGRLVSCYHPVGSKTRLSSTSTHSGYGVNGQNQPKRMKNYLNADEGCLMAQLDLSQAENRIVAYLAEDPAMMGAFERGEDIHRMTASRIFHKPPSEISNEEGSSTLGDGTHSERFWGKKVGHAADYMIGASSLSEELEIPVSTARALLYAYFSGFPNIQNVFQAGVLRDLRTTRTLFNLMGRHRYFYKRLDVEREAFSWIPQSTVPDIINQRGLQVIEEAEELIMFEPLNQVHDSILIQCNVEEWGMKRFWEGLRFLKASLEQPLQCKGRSFAIPVDVEVGKVLGRLEKVNVEKEIENAEA